MILSPLLSFQLRSKFSCWLKQSRSIRPTIKIAKDKFQLSIDVRNFDKDEICVKARPEYVIIEGKHEKKTKRGLIMRQFTRKFRLPDGCNVVDMKSKLSPDGILTIIAPRKTCEASLPCETIIPITHTGKPKQQEDSFVPTKEDICSKYTDKEKPPPDKKF